MQTDLIDQLQAQWRAERPELDPAPMGVVGRVLRLALLLQQGAEQALEPFGLTLWQFDVLATLRRLGRPYRLSPTQLLREVMLSSGAMTNRIDRLEALALVRRLPDPADRRGVLIELTAKGRQLIDRAIAARFDQAQSVVDHLSQREREHVEHALRQLLVQLETPDVSA